MRKLELRYYVWCVCVCVCVCGCVVCVCVVPQRAKVGGKSVDTDQVCPGIFIGSDTVYTRLRHPKISHEC